MLRLSDKRRIHKALTVCYRLRVQYGAASTKLRKLVQLPAMPGEFREGAEDAVNHNDMQLRRVDELLASLELYLERGEFP